MQQRIRMVPTVLVLIGSTLLISLSCAFVIHIGSSFGDWLALVPRLVLHGHIWRLATSVLLETHPTALIFNCLLLYWIGTDLAYYWGSRKLLSFYFGFAAFVNVLVVAISWLLWPEALDIRFSGMWPIEEALVIMWAYYFPEKQLRLFFIMPVGGKILIWSTVAIISVLTIYSGITQFLPHIIAEGSILLYIFIIKQNRHWIRFYSKIRRKPHLQLVYKNNIKGRDL